MLLSDAVIEFCPNKSTCSSNRKVERVRSGTVRCSVAACLTKKSLLLHAFQITDLCFYKSINTETSCFVSADKQAFSAAAHAMSASLLGGFSSSGAPGL